MKTDVHEIFKMLGSDDLLHQISGINAARELIDQIVQRSVQILFSAPKENAFAISDRLFAMGPVVAPELERHLRTGGEPEAMTYAALILMQFGSRAGVPLLLQALREGSGASGAIATQLAAADVAGAGEAITDALKRWPLCKDPYTAVTMISALRTLNASVPDEVLRELNLAAPEIRKLL